MELLLDECVDRRLTGHLRGHSVETVPRMGWATIKNGRLLDLAEQRFDAFLTVDRNLSFQQNVNEYDIAVLVLHARTNRLVDLQPLVPEVLRVLPHVKSGQVVSVGV